ncbi:MAG: glycosyltransferase family 1 protein [Solirubrobacteraceae bacterium]|jgi:alpha-1,3-rhamnosyl/mannosyltransferase
MRIAIDARAAAEVRAGHGRYLRELLAALGELDVDHEFLLFARAPWLDGALDERFVWRLVNAPTVAWPLRAGRAMSAEAAVALACTTYAMSAAWRVPGVVVVHDLAAFDRSLGTPRGSLLERVTLPLAVRRAQGFIAVSEATAHQLGERYPQTTARTVVIPEAASPRFSPAVDHRDAAMLARYGIQTPFVLCVGTLEPRKNLPRLIAAFARLDATDRQDWKLVLAGASGWQTDATFEAVAQHGELVVTLGFVSDDDLARLYRQATVFCYPSLYEGFGLPVLEAMQSGTAVITSAVSSMPEVGGAAARYVDPYDTADISGALVELMRDEQHRRRLAAAGIEQSRNFSWQHTAQATLDVLERVAS